MTAIDAAALDQMLKLLPRRYKGPGGVAGVVKDGQVIARHAWGFADMYRRLPMTAATRLPICSLSKQFTCALLLDQFEDPAALDLHVRDFIPDYRDTLPTVEQLCHNQSGLRDYWALTVLQGAEPEAEFTRETALPLIARSKTGHFPAGKLYSYNNANFRMIGELIERGTGRAFGELLAERIFAPAGMKTAELAADTRFPLDGVVGYEGNDDVGFLPAQNGVFWFGDSGIAASLDDLLAWELHIDATRNDPRSLYNRLSVPVTYADGSPASYGYGLRRDTVGGIKITGHGGGLRGFSSFRLHAADERLSVVVMFNHDTSTFTAATALLNAALGRDAASDTVRPENWDGLWLDEEQGLVVRTAQDTTGVKLYYAPSAARLTVSADGVASGHAVSLKKDGELLVMQRENENLQVTARPLVPIEWADGFAIAGSYWSDELEAHLEIEARDGAVHALFRGMLGTGPMERMYVLAEDIWIITTRRSMDAAPPGDWTVQVERNAAGTVAGLTIGCWLARKISYRRINAGDEPGQSPALFQSAGEVA
ncbi:D-aminopeptidase [Ensifer adhaerens]|uniref:D-aminopeptidase n=1 Tax=Ensifer adhaerens TaxID=106592 RepID=UPI001CBFFCA6|nr:D-aminopeptidase [Ensifer adhaerens]MBZ7926531.1 D-aminopeptidase [Ensifer adhaerens]UAX97129.1 D-aminopeptidase [Ensifer adhaerens]